MPLFRFSVFAQRCARNLSELTYENTKEALNMALKIRNELKKHLSGIRFNVKKSGGDWYEVVIKYPAKTVKDAKKAINIKDMVYEKMAGFETDNGIILTITI